MIELAIETDKYLRFFINICQKGLWLNLGAHKDCIHEMEVRALPVLTQFGLKLHAILQLSTLSITHAILHEKTTEGGIV